MNLVVWLLMGGLIGWVASILMGTDGREGLISNVVVGVVGAALGGWALSNIFGSSTINQGNFSVSSLVVSFLGAVMLLVIVKILRRA